MDIQSDAGGLRLLIRCDNQQFRRVGRWIRYPDLFEFEHSDEHETGQFLRSGDVLLTTAKGRQVRWKVLGDAAKENRSPAASPTPPPMFLGYGTWLSSSGNRVVLRSRQGKVWVDVVYKTGPSRTVEAELLSKTRFRYATSQDEVYDCEVLPNGTVRCLRMSTGRFTTWKRLSGGLNSLSPALPSRNQAGRPAELQGLGGRPCSG